MMMAEEMEGKEATLAEGIFGFELCLSKNAYNIKNIKSQLIFIF